jgi:hypothetical protein
MVGEVTSWFMLPSPVDELSRPVGFVMQIRLQRSAPAGTLNDLSSDKDSVPVRGDSEFEQKKKTGESRLHAANVACSGPLPPPTAREKYGEPCCVSVVCVVGQPFCPLSAIIASSSKKEDSPRWEAPEFEQK